MLEGPQPCWPPEFKYSSNIFGVYSTLSNINRWRRVVQIADRQLPQLTLEAEILGDTATQSNNHDNPILFNPIYKSLYDTCNSERFQQENILSSDSINWNKMELRENMFEKKPLEWMESVTNTSIQREISLKILYMALVNLQKFGSNRNEKIWFKQKWNNCKVSAAKFV